MPVDNELSSPVNKPLAEKSSEEVTNDEVRTLLNAPDESGQRLVEPDLFSELQPKPPIYKSIPLKAGVAAAVALLGIIPLLGLFSGNLLPKRSPVASTSDGSEKTTPKSEEQLALDAAAENNAQLKKDLALQNQAFTAEEMDAAATTESADASQTTLRPVSPATPSRQAAPVTRPVAAVAARPAARSTAPRPLPVTRTSPVVESRGSAEPRFTGPSGESIDLATLANAGNYGQLPSGPLPAEISWAGGSSDNTFSSPELILASASGFSGANTGSIPVSVSTRSSLRTSTQETNYQGRRSRPVPKVMQDKRPEVFELATTEIEDPYTASPVLEVALASDEAYEADRNLIMGDVASPERQEAAPLYVSPGTTASAQVTTAITWAADLPKAQGAITLTSPLISNGFEILPTGTDLIVQIGAMSESGAVVLEAISIVLPGSAEMTAFNIPRDAFEILTVDGGYPVATAENSSERQLRTIDRQQAILGAISGAGNFLSRPTRESSFFGNGGNSSTVREYDSGSLVGSLLSGAATEVLRGRSSRLEDEAERIADRPTIWSLEPGRALQIFITREVQL